MDPHPQINPDLVPLTAPNPAARVRFAFEGGDVASLVAAGLEAVTAGSMDPALLLDLGVLYQLVGEPDKAMLCQQAALEQQRLYRHDLIGPVGGPPAPTGVAPLRLLAVVTAGDLMTNTPLDLMLEGCAVEVTKLYVGTDAPIPAELPDHDVAILAVSESDGTRELLNGLSGLARIWPRPVINDAGRIAALARDTLYQRLKNTPGIVIPPTLRIARPTLEAMLEGGLGPGAILVGWNWPIIVRPVGSHAGKGLERLDDAAALGAYLAEQQDPMLYVSPYIDYAGGDSRFRKYRIAFFAGRPFLAHMAVGDHWMVHYLNAGMAEDAGKRDEERRAMEGFDEGFARRHAGAFAALHARIGLDYFAIDCAETPDGGLLVFEADVAMIVHDLDPPDLYPYKKPQMRKVFDAFEAFLRAKAASRVNQT
jgi:hypothetical protein